MFSSVSARLRRDRIGWEVILNMGRLLLLSLSKDRDRGDVRRPIFPPGALVRLTIYRFIGLSVASSTGVTKDPQSQPRGMMTELPRGR